MCDAHILVGIHTIHIMSLQYKGQMVNFSNNCAKWAMIEKEMKIAFNRLYFFKYFSIVCIWKKHDKM